MGALSGAGPTELAGLALWHLPKVRPPQVSAPGECRSLVVGHRPVRKILADFVGCWNA